MNNINLFDMLCVLMYTVGVMVFCSVCSHLLLSLLSLDYLVLVHFMLLFYYMMKCGCGSYIILLYLTDSVCEGVLGLSILVALIRCQGNDNLSSMMMLW